MIKVLVVDDSAVARDFLVHLIDGAPDMEVVGTAIDGCEAISATQRLHPDVISMDIVMPRMGGPEAIEQIMQTMPTPIVVVTGNTITEEVRATFESLDSGALAIVPRPFGLGCSNHAESSEQLLRTLRLMSEIRVIRRLPRRAPRPQLSPNAAGVLPPRTFRGVAIGASTGGPSALKAIIGELPEAFPVPVLVAQHIAPGFVEGFAGWLADSSRLRVRLGVAGEKAVAGTVYVAPDGAHFGLGRDERIVLTPPGDRPAGGVCPSVDRLFASVALAYGPQAIGVLLTGMGRDGAQGLLAMKRAGGATIAQDRESSVVYGMPAEAVALGAADLVLPPPRIADVLTNLAMSGLAPRT